MKNILQLIVFLSLSVTVSAQTCVIDVTPTDTTICPGDSVLITAYAGLISSNQQFNFNGGALPAGWSVSGGSTFSAPCETSLDNTPYYWASTSTSSNPDITTAAFDVSCGGIITFDMDYATQADPAPCEGPDEMDEGVSLQYSTNGGLGWTTIIYYCPDGNTYPANTWIGTTIVGVGAGQATQFTSWDTYSVVIPAAAQTPNTMFRWIQESPTSGTSFDNWGVDNIIINASGPPCSDAIVNWGGITDTLNWFLTDTTSFYMVPFTDTIYMAMVYDSLGNYMCSSDSLFVSLSPDDMSYSLVDTVSIYCPTDSILVNVTNMAGGTQPYSYNWSNGYTTSSAYLQGGGSPTDTLTYYLDIFDNCGYSRTDSVVLVVDIPTVTFNVVDTVTIYCPTDSIQVQALNAAGGTGPYSYNWSNGYTTANAYLQGNGNAYDTLTFYVDVYDACGYTSNDSVVLVVDVPTITFDLVDTVTLYCPTDSLQVQALNAAGGTGPYSYNWSNGYTTASAYLQGNGNLFDTLTFYVDVYDACGYTSNDSVVMVITNFLDFTLPDTVYTYCPYDSVLVDVTNIIGGTGPYSYNWSNGYTTDSAYVQADSLKQDEIWYFVTVSDNCGYTHDDSVLLVVNQTLTIDSLVQNPASGCNPDGSVIAYISGQTGVPLYHWDDQANWDSLGQGNFIDASTWLDLGSGWYYFTVTDDVCADTGSIFVEMNNPPQAVINPIPSSGCEPLAVTFENNSVNANNYYWDFGNGQTTTTSNTGSQNQIYGVSSQVMLIAYSTPTCGDTAYADINIIICGCTDELATNYNPNAQQDDGSCVYPIPEVISPNVFTPNGDGDNDYFWFEMINVVSMEYTITNRWGNVMHSETIDLTSPNLFNLGWDGRTNSGAEAQEGTYFYTYKATGINGDIAEGHGFLHLVRD